MNHDSTTQQGYLALQRKGHSRLYRNQREWNGEILSVRRLSDHEGNRQRRRVRLKHVWGDLYMTNDDNKVIVDGKTGDLVLSVVNVVVSGPYHEMPANFRLISDSEFGQKVIFGSGAHEETREFAPPGSDEVFAWRLFYTDGTSSGVAIGFSEENGETAYAAFGGE